MGDGSAKLAHKIFVHRLIFNWIFLMDSMFTSNWFTFLFYFRLTLAVLLSFALSVAFLFHLLFLPFAGVFFFIPFDAWTLLNPRHAIYWYHYHVLLFFSFSSFLPSLSSSICLSLANSILVSFVLATVFSRSTLFCSELSDPVFALSSAYLLKLL